MASFASASAQQTARPRRILQSALNRFTRALAQVKRAQGIRGSLSLQVTGIAP